MSDISILLNSFSFFLYWILIFFIVIKIILKRRSFFFLLSWLFIIYLISFFGIFAYLFYENLYLDKKKILKIKKTRRFFFVFLENFKRFKNLFCERNNYISEDLFKFCKNKQGIGGIYCNNIRIIDVYEIFFNSIIKDINSASHSIEMVFYVWKPGGFVNKVIDALINASKKGVRCRVLIDSFGSWSFFHTNYPKKMRLAGIELVESLKINFFCLFLRRRIDVRQHKKMIVIDNSISYIGSMNMIDPFFFKKNTIGIVDIIIRIKGPVSVFLSMVHSFYWNIETNQNTFPIVLRDNIKKFKHNVNSAVLQVIVSKPIFSKELIKQSIIISIFSARERLIFTTPYFVPSDDLIQAICTVAIKGVKVFIIIPDKNNSFLVHWASRVFFSKLLKSGVKIYRFKGGFLHTKSILVDNELSFIGSVNLDFRSFFLNFEIIIAIDNEDFNKNLTFIQYNYISNSTILLLKDWKKRPTWNRIIESLCYFFCSFL